MLLEKNRSSLYTRSCQWIGANNIMAGKLCTYGSKRLGLTGKLGPLVFRDTIKVKDHLGKPPAVLCLPLADPLDITRVIMVC